MTQQIKHLPLILACMAVSLSAMEEGYNILSKPTLNTIPHHYSTIISLLQITPVYNNQSIPKLHNHRIYVLERKEDCQIIEILCKNANILSSNNIRKHPLAITRFEHNLTHDNQIKYGIKCPSYNQNYLKRRVCFKVIDALREGWVELPADDYYTYPYKTQPNDNPHKDTINDWRFFSKRTDALRSHFLQSESALIRCLAIRFGMTDQVTCRTTMTKDLKRIAAIHIWVLKSAFEEFTYAFDFDCELNDKDLNWLKILNA